MALMDILAKMGIDTADFNKGIKEAEKTGEGFGGKLRSFFAITGALAAVGAVKEFADACGEAVDAADRFGTTVETIQRVDAVSKQAGSSMEEVGKILQKTTLDAKKATEGSLEQAKSFRSVGISAKQFIGLHMDQKIILLAKAYEDANGDTNKMADLIELVGGKGSKIFPMLAGGAKGVSDAMAEIPVITDETARKMDNLADKIEVVKRNITASAGWTAGKIFDSLDFVANKFNNAINGAQDKALDPTKIEAGRKAAEAARRKEIEDANSLLETKENESKEQQQAWREELDIRKDENTMTLNGLDLRKKTTKEIIEGQMHCEKIAALESMITTEKISQDGLTEQALSNSKGYISDLEVQLQKLKDQSAEMAKQKAIDRMGMTTGERSSQDRRDREEERREKTFEAKKRDEADRAKRGARRDMTDEERHGLDAAKVLNEQDRQEREDIRKEGFFDKDLDVNPDRKMQDERKKFNDVNEHLNKEDKKELISIEKDVKTIVSKFGSYV